MQKLLSKRLPIAWFLMSCIVVAGAGILIMLITNGAVPSNAVLIESAEDAEDLPHTTPQPIARQVASPTITTSQAAALPAPEILSIYVSGAVQAAGVYTLPAGSRVNDALKAAGGASNEADLEQINLAALVTDQEHIRVPRLGESPVAEATRTAASQDKGSTTTASAPGQTGEKLNLNNATALELEALPGIGSVLAARIVADRDQHGPFRSVEDITRVAGIKEGLLARFRDQVTVGP